LAERPATVDELLSEARRELERLLPRDAFEATRHGAILVDVRSDSQRAADGTIPTASFVSRNVLEWRLDPSSEHRDPELARHDRQVILICNEGYQSSLAAASVRRLGIDATDVIGGFQAWQAADLPVTRHGSQSPASFDAPPPTSQQRSD
jgi:rhodanese-related sulfurtransferase